MTVENSFDSVLIENIRTPDFNLIKNESEGSWWSRQNILESIFSRGGGVTPNTVVISHYYEVELNLILRLNSFFNWIKIA